jgi:hypothetical protein
MRATGDIPSLLPEKIAWPDLCSRRRKGQSNRQVMADQGDLPWTRRTSLSETFAQFEDLRG